MAEEECWKAAGILAGIRVCFLPSFGGGGSAFGTARLPVWGQLNTA